MELKPKHNNSGESGASELIELPVFEKGHQSVYPNFAEQESPLLHYRRILKKRRWTMAATLGIIFALSAIITRNFESCDLSGIPECLGIQGPGEWFP